MSAVERPTPATLSKLSGLNELSQEELASLSNKLEVRHVPKGEVLLERGSNETTRLYLVQGRLHLRAEDGAMSLVSHEDPSALSPIARLRPSRYEVVAATNVHYLSVPEDLLEGTDSSLEYNSSLLDAYQVEETEYSGDEGQENQLTLQIYEDLNSDQLLLPSLPDVAIRVGQAINEDYADSQKVVHIIENDPTIAAKILKAANSARYGGSQQISRLQDAIVRIGMNTVHQLVITFALRELFRCNSAHLNKRMREIWEHSRQVGAIAHVLAKHCKNLDPETALLAGLVHDIGSVAVLGYARDFPEINEHPGVLEASMRQLRGQLGNMILVKWQLPAFLAEVASEAEHWQREHKGACDYIDLIIIAKLHALIGHHQNQELPEIDQTPAYAKLGFGEGSPESSMQILELARQEIRETLALLGA